MEEGAKKLGGIIIIIGLLSNTSLAASGPMARLSEENIVTYFENGSLQSAKQRGWIDVDANNNDDVLQFIELTLSNINNTNLQSNKAKRSVAASAEYGAKTRLLVNTTENPNDYYYTITSDLPRINMKLAYSNLLGGREVYTSEINTLNFSLAVSSNISVKDALMNLNFAKNVLGLNDSLNVTSIDSKSSGETSIMDTDYDGYNDLIEWRTDIETGEDAVMIFSAQIIPNENFNTTLLAHDLNGNATSRKTFENTLSNISFSSLFSRGPIREGLEILILNNTAVRGFIKNTAKNLTYKINNWALIHIGGETLLNRSTPNTTLTPSEIKYTDWHLTENNKSSAYYAAFFNWEVEWGGTEYSGVIDATLHFDKMYGFDFLASKNVKTISLQKKHEALQVNDTVQHLGHSKTSIEEVQISSEIPRVSERGFEIAWQTNEVKVHYINSSGYYEDVTSISNITKAEGYVNISIKRTLEQNDKIMLSYLLNGTTAHDSSFKFEGGVNVKTGTGMFISKNFAPSIIFVPRTEFISEEVLYSAKKLTSIENVTSKLGEEYSVNWTEDVENEFINRTQELLKASSISISREVMLEENKSSFKVELANKGNIKLANITIIEEISKAVAQSIDEIIFETPPTKVIASDPIVLWKLEELSAGQNISIQYGVNKKLEESELTNLSMPIIFIEKIITTEAPALVEAVKKPVLAAELITESMLFRIIPQNKTSITVSIRAVDSGSLGVWNTTPAIYAPINSKLKGLSLRIFNGREWTTQKDIQTISDTIAGQRIITIKKSGAGWDLHDGNLLELNYELEFPPGTHIILSRFSGYEPYKKMIITEDVRTSLRIDFAPIEEPKTLIINETPFEQGKAIVGEPVTWLKKISAHNPNNAVITQTIKIPILPDSIATSLIENSDASCILSLFNLTYAQKCSKNFELSREQKNSSILLKIRLNPLEVREYYIKTLTPPIIETKLEDNIINSTKTRVFLRRDILLTNFAKETYQNISLKIEDLDKIIGVEQNSLINNTIIIEELKGEKDKMISILYYEDTPFMSINLENEILDFNSTLNYKVIIVPSQNSSRINLEIETVGAPPELETIYAEIFSFDNLEEGKKYNIERTITLPSLLLREGRYSLKAALRKDFANLIIASKEFTVRQAPPEFYKREREKLTIIFTLASLAVILLFLITINYHARGRRSFP